MQVTGQPFVIQNTTGPEWLIFWEALLPTESTLERISFTVAIPRRADLPIDEVQRHALKRAAELLRRAEAAVRRDPEPDN